MKRLLCIPAALVLLLSLNGALSEESSTDSTGRFFEKPEDAIVYFVERVAEADFEGAMRTTAAQAMAEGYELQLMIERLGAFVSTMGMRWPSSEYEAYAPLNRIAQEAFFERQLYGMVSSLLIDASLNNGYTRELNNGEIQINESDTIPLETLTTALDPARLKDLSIKSIYRLDSERYMSEMHQANIAKQGAPYGYTDAKEFVVIYRFEDSFYAHSYTVIKFPEGWQIYSLSAAFLGTDLTGAAIPIPEEEIGNVLSESDYTKVYETE